MRNWNPTPLKVMQWSHSSTALRVRTKRWFPQCNASSSQNPNSCGRACYNCLELFNCVPQYISDLIECSVKVFKSNLNNFLRTRPEVITVPRYIAVCRVAITSFPDQVNLQQRDARAGCSSGTSEVSTLL